jgi:nitrite reductase (NADH) small subunit
MTQSARWTYVCRLHEIVPNTGVCARVGKTQVAVFRLVSPQGEEEGVHAIANHDPQAGANVLSRGLVGDLGGERVVASQVYKHHYSLLSGRCLEDEHLRVAVYPVRLSEDGLILVCVP